jgi:nucleoside-diphosphate-sugar epimerase
MKVLVTGNLGYIGSVLVPILLDNGHEVIGFDIGYYKDCFLYNNDINVKQITKDIRDVSLEDVHGIDAIIHLAALSNDPLGELSPGLTEEINLMGTLRIAELAKQAGVKRFIYSSSQSMYGISKTNTELEEDSSEKNPITSYARTKWDAELALNKMQSDIFTVVSFRPSTVFGASPRLRCDIVFNNLVACAYTTGKIEIKSDGTPRRPVVHVKDVCAAYIAGLNAPVKLLAGRAFNVGIPNGNFTVRQLAEAAQRAVPGSELTFTGEHGNDARTYVVSFERILTELSDYFKPEWDLDKGGKELVELFKKVSFTENDFRGRKTTRLAQLSYLQEFKQVDNQMRLTKESKI